MPFAVIAVTLVLSVLAVVLSMAKSKRLAGGLPKPGPHDEIHCNPGAAKGAAVRVVSCVRSGRFQERSPVLHAPAFSAISGFSAGRASSA